MQRRGLTKIRRVRAAEGSGAGRPRRFRPGSGARGADFVRPEGARRGGAPISSRGEVRSADFVGAAAGATAGASCGRGRREVGAQTAGGGGVSA